MLKSAMVIVRAAALLMTVGAMFIGPTAGGTTRVVQIVCLAVGTSTLVVWAALSRGRGPEQARLDRGLLPVVLFGVMSATSVAALSDHGRPLMSFAIIAAAAAGGRSALVDGWIVAATGMLAIIVGAAVVGAPLSSTVGYCLTLVVALLIGHSRRSYRVQADQATLLLARADQLRTEQSLVATLTERARIAREVHDVLAHSLGALAIQIQVAAVLSERNDAQGALAVLDRAHRIAAEGLVETRRAVHTLRTDNRPLEQELAQLIAAHQITHDVQVTLEIHGHIHSLPPDATIALLRIAQESLVNAAKHATGQPVTMRLDFSDSQTTLTVVNALPGLASAAAVEPRPDTIADGYGLVGMRERLLLLHGSLSARARAGHWEVAAEVPR